MQKICAVGSFACSLRSTAPGNAPPEFVMYRSVCERARGPVDFREMRPHRGHPGEPGDGFGAQVLQQGRRGGEISKHRAGAHGEGRRHLAETIVEADGQRREQPVFGGVAQVARHADRARDHVAMRNHHALGPPGAAGGVENRERISIDRAEARARRHATAVPRRAGNARASGARCRSNRTPPPSRARGIARTAPPAAAPR